MSVWLFASRIEIEKNDPHLWRALSTNQFS